MMPLNRKPVASVPARRMLLGAVTTGVQKPPVKVIVYGPGGIGKTTFASHAPSPLFLPTEDGSHQLDVARLPRATSWSDVLDGVDEATTAEHAFETLVVDTITGAEGLLFRAICDERSWQDIESPGFGKGEKAALDRWRELLSRLERLQEKRRMHVILIGHSAVKPFNDPNPLVGRFDRYALNLCTNKDGDSCSLLIQWADDVLFANHELTKKKSTDRQAISSGNRYLHTTWRSAFEAKNRHGLPERLPLDWDAYWSAVQSHAPASPAKLRARIAELLPRAPEEVRTAVQETAAAAGNDARELARIAGKLESMIEIDTGDEDK